MRSIFMIASLAALTAMAGCSKDQNKTQTQSQQAPAAPGTASAPGTAAAPSAPAEAGNIPEEARKVYAERCSSCHGPSGNGDGPASAALTPKPQNYHDAEWQKNTSDDTIKEVIVKGGAGVGKSPLMPPHPDLADKPDVLNGLVALIRSFGKQG